MQQPLGVSIGDVQSKLVDLVSRIRGVGRRAGRYSWYSWGFLLALYGGVIGGGVVGLAFPGFGASLGVALVFVLYLPGLLLLALAVREILLGRRESDDPGSALNPAPDRSTLDTALGWTAVVQESQRVISRAKSEIDFSILPLAFGILGLGESVSVFWFPLLINYVEGGFLVMLVLLIPVAFLTLVWPFYRGGRRWIGKYQSLLDQQVRDLSRLESEFYWKFSGVPAPP
jgi:hypothetical protein